MKYNDKYLARIVQGSHKGWYLRVPKDSKKSFLDYDSTFFPDRDHKGDRGAKKAAKEFRDDFLQKTNQMHLLECIRQTHEKIHPTDAKNTSGIGGVRLAFEVKEPSPGNICVYESWIGYGMKDRKSWSRSFSTNRYEEADAFHNACIERFNRHGPLYVTKDLSEFPCKIPVEYIKIDKEGA